MKKSPLVYIILINWNGYLDTIECIKSLKSINYSNYEIIVVDNNSGNNESKKIKKEFPGVFLIQNRENLGFCKANNQGIKYSIKNHAEYTLLLNNDTTVDREFLKRLINVVEKYSNIGLASAKTLSYFSNKILFSKGKHYDFFGISILGKKELKEDIEVSDFLSGCVLLISNKVIKKIGYLDEAYFAYIEDVDFSRRFKKAGYDIVVVKNSVIWHKKSSSAGYINSKKISSIQAYLQMRNTILFIRKHYSRLLQFIYIPINIIFKGGYLFYNLDREVDSNKLIRGIKDGIQK